MPITYLCIRQILAIVSRFCAEQKIDCALVPDKQRLASFGLCVMDMDSTLISD